MPNQNTKNQKEGTLSNELGDNSKEELQDSYIAPKSKRGSLSDAMMHTFKGDITTQMGGAAPEIIEKLVPGSVPEQDENVTILNAEALRQSDNVKQEIKQKKQSVTHTYKGDVEDLVKKQKLSLMRMAAMESNKKYFKDEKVNSGTGASMTLIFILMFVFIGIIALSGAYYTYVLREETVTETVPSYRSMFFTEDIEKIDVTDKRARAILQILATIRRNSYYSLGSVVELLPTQQVEIGDTVVDRPFTAKEMFKELDLNFPDEFVNSFDDKFMLGLHVAEDNAPFIILRVKAYDRVFAGMLAWEGRIEQDLAPLFSPRGEYSEPVTKQGMHFADTVMNNLDVRVLRDKSDDIRILYSFIDRGTLIITTQVHTLLEVTERLRVARQ